MDWHITLVSLSKWLPFLKNNGSLSNCQATNQATWVTGWKRPAMTKYMHWKLLRNSWMVDLSKKSLTMEHKLTVGQKWVGQLSYLLQLWDGLLPPPNALQWDTLPLNFSASLNLFHLILMKISCSTNSCTHKGQEVGWMMSQWCHKVNRMAPKSTSKANLMREWTYKLHQSKHSILLDSWE